MDCGRYGAGKPKSSARKFVRPAIPAKAPVTPPVAKPSTPPEDDGAESRRRKYGEEPASESENTPSETTEQYVHPSVAKFGSPSAKWFRLRRKDGFWLHMSGTGFTDNKNDGWIGKIGQLRTARERFPDAQGLQIVGVTVAPK